MPSYRVTLTLGALRPGVAPETVVPTVVEAVRKLAVVEAGDLQVVRGAARVVVRFTGDDAQTATQIGRHAASVAATAVEVLRWDVTERVGGQWETVLD